MTRRRAPTATPSRPSLIWVRWCCLACRRERSTVAWVAELPEVCNHTGTALSHPFWRAGGEPNTARLLDDASRLEVALREIGLTGSDPGRRQGGEVQAGSIPAPPDTIASAGSPNLVKGGEPPPHRGGHRPAGGPALSTPPTLDPSRGRDGARACALALEGLLMPGGQVYAVDIRDAPAVFGAALGLGFGQLWIGPTAARALKLPPTFSVPAGQPRPYAYGVPHPWLNKLIAAGHLPSTDPPGLAPWLTVAEGAGRTGYLDVVIPSWDPGGNPFAGAPSSGALLRALQLYASTVGVRYRRSPSATGLALMHHVHDGGVSLPEPHLPPPALELSDSEAEGAWLSPRPIPAASWVHGWDINGMYLAACSDAWLGFGRPQHDLAPRNLLDGRPGYYRARVTPPPGEGPSWPLPIRADGAPRWYVQPSLRLAVDLGCSIELLEAWVYPERYRWLGPWYEALRDARRDLLALIGPPPGTDATHGRQLALAAVKATYTRSLGRLAGQWLQEGDATFRPDWRAVVIARARANMHRHLERVARVSGEPPLALTADTALYLSPHKEPARAAVALGLEVSSQLGKWKHAGRLDGATAARIAGGDRSGPSRLAALVAALEPGK